MNHSAGRTKLPANRSRRGKAALRGSIGPVEDLESYVRADWWRDIFNANYLRTDGDVVDDPGITSTEIDAFLELLDIDAGTPILDLCCGQGRHVIELGRRGYNKLFGVDRSHYLVARARRDARQANVKVTFREGDARKLRFGDDQFGLVYIAGNSFGYFETVDDDVAVLKEVRRILKPGGQLLIDFTDGDFLRANFEARSWEWIDRNYFVCRERSLSKDGARLISREVISHTKKGVVADQFYAERLYTAADIAGMLRECGFVPDETRSMSTHSKRNQDLGMMAQRIVLTARSAKASESQPRVETTVRSIAVLLGDPGKHDDVKPNGRFDADDHYTVSELKSALADIPAYEFEFMDDHDRLVEQLSAGGRRIDLVLNLCDEGFDNEPTQELHVPALLEMLDIPYTGGSPQCLAFCYDKSLVRGVAAEMDIPVPAAYLVAPEQVAFIAFPIEFPVIVKPNFGDSSVGITAASVCSNVDELEQAIAAVRRRTGYARPVLVEQFLTGKDISVGIIGNPPDSYRVLPIIEEDYSRLPDGLPRICGYEAKWEAGSAYFDNVTSIAAELPQETVEFLGASCVRLFQRLDCRDYARFDWRLDDNGTPRLLEVNPNPGWCWDGHLARMAELEGSSYARMLRDIIEAGIERCGPAIRARRTGPAASQARAAVA